MGGSSSKRRKDTTPVGATRPNIMDMTIQFGNLRVVIAHGDLTKENIGAIVNSSNMALDLTKGATAKAIAKAGGRSVVEECEKLGKTRPNGIAVTGAGNLPCRYIIHVDMHKKADWDKTITAILLEAASLGLESVAFPAIGTGAHHLPPTDMAKRMLDAFDSFSTHNVFMKPKVVRIVIFEKSMLQTFRNCAKEKAKVNLATESGPKPSATVKTIARSATAGHPSTLKKHKKHKKSSSTVMTSRIRDRFLSVGEVIIRMPMMENVALPRSVLEHFLNSAMKNARAKTTRKSGDSAKEKPTPDCNYMKACQRYFGTLGISEAYVNSEFTICYCTECHVRRKDSDVSKRGQPPKIYAIPVGWCRIGLQIDARTEANNLFNTWHRAYHGTEAESVKHILDGGGLLIPGDRALSGKDIGERPNHFNKKTKPPGFDTQRIFVSPSIIYAGHDTYATPASYTDAETRTSYKSRVALQVLIAPDSYRVRAQTIGAKTQIDNIFSNEVLEWSTVVRGSIIIYSLLIRLEAVG